MSTQTSWVPPDIDVDRASPARVYDYLLGGAWNFQADREMAHAAVARMPWVRDLARYNRTFLGRAVRYCAEAGINQFLDLGSGMPTSKSVHEMAVEIDPESRVVYVEQEQVAVAHSELILATVPGADILGADMRAAEEVLASPVTLGLLDLTEPVAVIMASSLHYVLDADEAAALVRQYLDAVPAGSYLVLSHITDDGAEGSAEVRQLVELSRSTTAAGAARSRDWIASLFAGLDLVDPGLVFTSQWRPNTPLRLVTDLPAHASLLAAVARKP
ncbi:SAM-dependent methyltransferase [Crossiella sp. CA198]|uniref:SAM-dependent methyltransferase n=1 Tax=Crossiella sp. CA198 TaxID=3455607 RepID=UPI003F8D2215